MTSIIGGLLGVALGILALLAWPYRVMELIQGLIPLLLIIGGGIALAGGLSILKDKTISQEEEEEDIIENKELE